MYRQLELDQATLRKSNATLEKALRDGKQLTRVELASIFQKEGFLNSGMRMGYCLMYAELEASFAAVRGVESNLLMRCWKSERQNVEEVISR